jgi:PST family polysaccharide transporter
MSLKKSTATGVKWSSVSQIGRQMMQIATLILLARLLSPKDFGLVGMATVFTGFLAIFKDLGTSAAIIQREETSDRLLHSIFWVNVGFGFFATAFLLGISPLVGSFYHNEKVSTILSVLSVTFLISSFSILHQALLERDLKFNQLAKIEISATLFASLVGIGSAYLGAGVWSLIYQNIALVSLTTILLWVTAIWKPKLIFDWAEVKSVSSYSLHLTGFSIFNYFARNADYFLIGRFLGAQALGYYTLAYRIMLYPLQNIVWVIGRVLFPVFSQMQNDSDRFCYAYIRVTRTIALITFPLMAGLWALADLFVLSVFGPHWQPVILLLLILAPVGMVQSIGTTVSDVYQAKGRTDWMLRWGLFSGTFVVTAFCIGLQWGIIGIAGSYAAATALLVIPSFTIPFKLIGLSMGEFCQGLWRPFLCSLLMLTVLISCKQLFPVALTSAWRLGILVPIGGAAYLSISWLLNREQLQEALSFVGTKA